MIRPPFSSLFFFFNDTATTEIYTLSLHDALPILYLCTSQAPSIDPHFHSITYDPSQHLAFSDRKSTRLNSSHQIISYAVFCLKKKKIGVSSELVLSFDSADPFTYSTSVTLLSLLS